MCHGARGRQPACVPPRGSLQPTPARATCPSPVTLPGARPHPSRAASAPAEGPARTCRLSGPALALLSSLRSSPSPLTPAGPLRPASLSSAPAPGPAGLGTRLGPAAGVGLRAALQPAPPAAFPSPRSREALFSLFLLLLFWIQSVSDPARRRQALIPGDELLELQSPASPGQVSGRESTVPALVSSPLSFAPRECPSTRSFLVFGGVLVDFTCFYRERDYSVERRARFS